MAKLIDLIFQEKYFGDDEITGSIMNTLIISN